LNDIAHAQNPVLAFVPERLRVLVASEAARASGLTRLIHEITLCFNTTSLKNAFKRTCGLAYASPAAYASVEIYLLYPASLININRSRNKISLVYKSSVSR